MSLPNPILLLALQTIYDQFWHKFIGLSMLEQAEVDMREAGLDVPERPEDVGTWDDLVRDFSDEGAICALAQGVGALEEMQQAMVSNNTWTEGVRDALARVVENAKAHNAERHPGTVDHPISVAILTESFILTAKLAAEMGKEPVAWGNPGDGGMVH